MFHNNPKNNPCYKCEHRRMHCHSECKEYVAFDEANKKIREKVRKIVMVNETLHAGAARRYKHALICKPGSKERKHESLPGRSRQAQ